MLAVADSDEACHELVLYHGAEAQLQARNVITSCRQCIPERKSYNWRGTERRGILTTMPLRRVLLLMSVVQINLRGAVL